MTIFSALDNWDLFLYITPEDLEVLGNPTSLFMGYNDGWDCFYLVSAADAGTANITLDTDFYQKHQGIPFHIKPGFADTLNSLGLEFGKEYLIPTSIMPLVCGDKEVISVEYHLCDALDYKPQQGYDPRPELIPDVFQNEEDEMLCYYRRNAL